MKYATDPHAIRDGKIDRENPRVASSRTLIAIDKLRDWLGINETEEYLHWKSDGTFREGWNGIAPIATLPGSYVPWHLDEGIQPINRVRWMPKLAKGYRRLTPEELILYYGVMSDEKN